MSITNEEFDRIVFKVTESVLLRMPEVIGNLIQNHAEVLKLNKTLYEKHPEFKTRIDVVRSVVEEVERNNTALEYKQIIDLAIPKIKNRLEVIDSQDVKTRPKLNELNLALDEDNYQGVL